MLVLVGKDIKRFKMGNQVYGVTGFELGCIAEYKCMQERLYKWVFGPETKICITFIICGNLGADLVIDYTKEDSINFMEYYDFILDAVAKSKKLKFKEVCKKALSLNG